MSLREWAVPPLPGEDLVEREVTVGGTTASIAAHERFVDALDMVVEQVGALGDLAEGTELALTWGLIRFEERDGVLRATTQDSRSVLEIASKRVTDLSQLLWVEESWRAVAAAAGFEADVDVHFRRTKIWVTRQMLDRREPAELRHEAGKAAWFLGEQPFDERLSTNLAGSMKFAGNVFASRPEVIPAMAVPVGWKALVDHDRGIYEIRDGNDRVVPAE